MWKRNSATFISGSQQHRFSPLTGINYVETRAIASAKASGITVSVPLRGLIMWKLLCFFFYMPQRLVSVPLRGLIMWKLKFIDGMGMDNLFQSPYGD